MYRYNGGELMKHQMKLLEKPFQGVLNGTKKVEFRLYDDKRKQVKIGDTITFSKLPDLREKMEVEVLDLYPYPTFEELLVFLGYQGDELKEKLEGMYHIYTKEEEEKYGVLGIRIQKI